jgi:Holliday junction DNA helicase RuvA
MIGKLTGKLVECTPGLVLLEVAGVGYSVQIPLSTFYALSEAGRESVSLHVHTHVREDALQLFGFASPEERSAFELLIGISGVGPRLALAILSGIGVEELREAVALRDRLRLQKIPGVGKKTAERVLLELKDKMAIEEMAAAGGLPAAARGRRGQAGDGVRKDAVSALVNLGYAKNVAKQVVDTAFEELGAEPDLEPLLKDALGRIFR